MSSAWTASRAAVHWWAVLTAVLTFILLCSGGLVTSHGAGLAVPDRPNTFGYNMSFVEKRWADYESHPTLRGWAEQAPCGRPDFHCRYDPDKLKLATITVFGFGL